jgi:hypothetical protein
VTYFQILGMALWPAIFGILVARYTKNPAELKIPAIHKGGLRLFATTWFVAFVATLACGTILAALSVSADMVFFLGQFVIPIVCSTYYARRELRRLATIV